jgi:hypothetical protein
MGQTLAGIRPGKLNILLIALGLFAFYLIGLDQGQLLSVVQGSAAFDQNLIHEAVHDARHAAGFPCH